MHTNVLKSPSVPPGLRPFEVVERKGLGHPDSVADGIAEAVSRELSQNYIRYHGRILHHNVDKVHLIAGCAITEFGTGTVVKRPRVIIGGRATFSDEFEIEEIAEGAARAYVRGLCGNDIAGELDIEQRLGKTADGLEHVFDAPGALANDTSFGVGFSPLSETERLVLVTESLMRAHSKSEVSRIGKDIKIMAVRKGKEVDITIAVPVMAPFVDSAEEYNDVLDDVTGSMENGLFDYTSLTPRISINPERASGSYYLSATGYSWENGDDGAVGRGNRANGLITPGRSMSLEAIAGKNPVNHTGKIYNLLAIQIADRIAETYPGVDDVTATLVSEIGGRVDEPLLANVEISSAYDRGYLGIHKIVCDSLAGVEDLQKRILSGSVRVF